MISINTFKHFQEIYRTCVASINLRNLVFLNACAGDPLQEIQTFTNVSIRNLLISLSSHDLPYLWNGKAGGDNIWILFCLKISVVVTNPHLYPPVWDYVTNERSRGSFPYISKTLGSSSSTSSWTTTTGRFGWHNAYYAWSTLLTDRSHADCRA